MKMLLLLAVLLAGLLGLPSHAGAQQLSNMGKDFWIGYGHHVRMANTNAAPEKMQLYITGETATDGKVQIPGIGFEQSFSVSPRSITTIDIPRTAALTRDGPSNLGIHVSADDPVVVYSFIYVSAVSGATVCLPTNTLGRDYYSINFNQVSNEANCSSYFFVVAADTGTTAVEITPSATTLSGRAANVPFVVQLEQGQVYQVLGATAGYNGVDLTGSRIRSVNTGAGCKKIAVFCGSSKISIGCSSPGTSDNLYQQAYPTATWSRKYIAIPSKTNSNNFFRVIRPDPATNVKVNNQVIPATAFTRNFYYQFSGNQPCVIEADKAIMVAQYFPTEGCSGNNSTGDPEMIFLNPVDQNLRAVTLHAMQPNGVNIRQHFLNVVVPNTAGALRSFRVDGQPYAGFTPLAADSGFAYAQIATTKGTHYLDCDTGFNVIAYGFGSAESYGYSGGTRLRDLYQFPSVANEFARVDSAVTCAGSPFRLSMTFPFQAQQITWQLDSVSPGIGVTAPLPDSVYTTNGKTLYRYTMPVWQQKTTPGIYPIKVVVGSNIGDGCTSEFEFFHELKVYPKPVSGFTIQTAGCTNDTVRLNQTYTLQNVLAAKTWRWQPEGQTPADQPNPIFVYRQAGTYWLKLAVVNVLGCVSDTAVQTLTVHPRPVIGFAVQGPFCVRQPVAFTNQSVFRSGSIAAYTWTFGDGLQVQNLPGTGTQHDYARPGNYRVQLEAVTDKGCTGTPAVQTITVTEKPTAKFTAPFSCLGDTAVVFTNRSAISGPDTTLLFHWYFGDGDSGRATLPNPSYRYPATGDYTVRLIATSAGGCADTARNTITVSGANPKASFTLLNGNSQCSDTALELRNNSTVDGGRLYQMELFWDYVNNPNLRELVSMPQTGTSHRFNPPPFFTPQNKTYTVRMVVYSGQTCQSVSQQVVMLHALPQLQFDSLPRFCSADRPYTITQAQLRNTLTGKGIFSGTGVSSGGLFTPAGARVGSNRVAYTFVSNQGCNATASQHIIVYQSPRVDAGPDLVIRAGQTADIRARSSSTNLRYAWRPKYGLSDTTLLQPQASPRHNQAYLLQATTPEGCTATDTLNILAPNDLYIPNSFTPNGDGKNDYWRIPYLMNGERASVKVFNRDGYCVYDNQGGVVSWDGRHRGIALNGGTFVYVLVLEASQQVYKGTVTLVR